jgi:serine/threonine protein kinase
MRLARRRSLPLTDPMPAPRVDVDDDDITTARPGPAVAAGAGPSGYEVFDGRYLLLREVGKGGMGAVWIAYDTEDMRQVALKRILPKDQENETFRERFRREHQALGAVRHPGVPTLYRSGRAPDPGGKADGIPYFTMELIRGETLRKVLDAGPLEPVHALLLMIDLGKILMAVQAAGIIHRDVKPTNVLIEPGGRVRLIDFGACLPMHAFYRREEVVGMTATGEHWSTGEHECIGTPAYSDPAAMVDKDTTIRSDIYSVCTIAYEAITGRPRLDRESEMLRLIQTGEFPPQLSRLAAELRRGTERDPTRRHRSMAELVQTLEIIRGDLLRERMRVAPPRTRVARLAASAVVLALTAGAALYGALRPATDSTGEVATPAGTLTFALHEPPTGAAVLPAASAEPPGTSDRGPVPREPSETRTCTPAPSVPDEPRDPQVSDPAPSEPSEAGSRDAAPLRPPVSAEHRPSRSSPSANVLRRVRPALRACRAGGEPLKVALLIRLGRAAPMSINGKPPNPGDPLHRCVRDVLAKEALPVSATSQVHTLDV